MVSAASECFPLLLMGLAGRASCAHTLFRVMSAHVLCHRSPCTGGSRLDLGRYNLATTVDKRGSLSALLINLTKEQTLINETNKK